MRTRIFFVSGLAELFTCAWISSNLFGAEPQRCILVVYGRRISMPSGHLRETLDYAGLFGRWTQILDFTGLTDEILSAGNQDDALSKLNDYRNLFRSADDVILHTIWLNPEHVFLTACCNATITLFDNGVDSHSEVPVSDQLLAYGQRHIRTTDLARLQTAVYTLGDYAPVPSFARQSNIVVPSAAGLREKLVEIGEGGVFRVLSTKLGSSPDRESLVIGTAFSRTKRIEFDSEKSAYEGFILRARAGGDAVLFKEHPRAHQKTFDASIEGIALLQTSLPIEFLPCFRHIYRCASISSSALLMLKKIHGLSYELLGPAIGEKLNLPWLEQLRKYAS